MKVCEWIDQEVKEAEEKGLSGLVLSMSIDIYGKLVKEDECNIIVTPDSMYYKNILIKTRRPSKGWIGLYFFEAGHYYPHKVTGGLG